MEPLIDYNTRIFNCNEVNLVDAPENELQLELGYFEKVFVFFTAPYTAWFYRKWLFQKFSSLISIAQKANFSLLFHLSFFIYYGYVIIQKFCYAPTYHEILVAIVLVGICVAQIRRHMSGDTRKGLNRIFEDPFNILLSLSFILASIAGILRLGVKYENHKLTIKLIFLDF